MPLPGFLNLLDVASSNAPRRLGLEDLRDGETPLCSDAGAARIRGRGSELLSPVKDLGQERQEEGPTRE